MKTLLLSTAVLGLCAITASAAPQPYPNSSARKALANNFFERYPSFYNWFSIPPTTEGPTVQIEEEEEGGDDDLAKAMAAMMQEMLKANLAANVQNELPEEEDDGDSEDFLKALAAREMLNSQLADVAAARALVQAVLAAGDEGDEEPGDDRAAMMSFFKKLWRKHRGTILRGAVKLLG